TAATSDTAGTTGTTGSTESAAATATVEGGTLPVAGKFPPPGVDIVTHRLQLGIQRVTPGASGKLPDKCQTAESVGATVEELERIDFSGRMILRREAATKVGGTAGRDRQNFKVLAWAASGYSKKLNVALQYVLSPESEAPQPMSSIISEKEGPGFPVAFNFNLVFDAYANGRLVEARHHGAPEGHGFESIPPGPDAPKLTKFESCFVQMPDPSKPGSLLRFFPIECKDQHAETVQVLGGS
ncbi:MAG TPA: hypothetical protein VJ032_06200, partial [Thermoanaerobaculia bacterium]|nr:hypothetical protein [Thermoanaerobaculia bacterium]